MSFVAGKRHRRAALSNPAGRFAATQVVPTREHQVDRDLPRTVVQAEHSKSIITRNDSPDLSFRFSINPYRGCEHGCVYCYARPSHAYMDLSPGEDFETRLFSKPDAPRLLREALRRPGYVCEPIALGTNTDPYQPVEAGLGITRQLLQVFLEFSHPVTIVTKSALVLRDLDLLEALAARELVSVTISITSLNPELKRRMEPAAASAGARLHAISVLSEAGVPAGVFVAPVIPGLTDSELESILAAAGRAGASHALYSLLRLPGEVALLFREWLAQHYPLQAKRVMSLIMQSRGGRDNDPRFGYRMTGTGPIAELTGRRFRAACKKAGIPSGGGEELDRSRFRACGLSSPQLDLF